MNNLLRTSQVGAELMLPPTMLGGDGTLTSLGLFLRPRFAVLQRGPHWLWVGTQLSGNFVIDEAETFDVDRAAIGTLPLQVGYGHTFVERDDGLVVRAGPEGSLALPLDENDRRYIDLATSLGVVGDVNIPLARGAWWNGVFFHGTFGWQHQFLDDQPGGEGVEGEFVVQRFVPRDRLTLGIAGWINVWEDLSIGNSWTLGLPFNYPPQDQSCFQLATGDCADSTGGSASEGSSYIGTLQISVGYLAARTFWMQLAYNNTVAERSDGGNIFSSDFATISLSGTLLVDRIFERARH